VNSGVGILTVGELGALPNDTLDATFFANATLDRLVVGTNQQIANASTFTVFINGVQPTTTLTCTIPANTTLSVCSDIAPAHAMSVTAGSTFSLHVTSANFPSQAVHFRVRVH
jgi:hypothetical protein